MSENTAILSEKNTKPPQNESMVVKMSSLDNMLELAGEVIIVSSNLNALGRNIREGLEVSHEISQDIKDLAITSSRISSDLHNLVSDVRTVDMCDLFARFKRLARDTSRRLGKAVRFEVTGQEICIDKKTSEKIYDPIAHQIRNAMAHGIEDEQTRRNAGKDPVGTVKLEVVHSENSTIIKVIDDGGGVNFDRIRNKVVEQGYSDVDSAAKMAQSELLEYLYLPGFSTSEQASSTSGRGVGLDVVRNIMNELGGETKIETKPGEGTTFSFVLPKVTAVNISDALLVRANNTFFAFPILSVVASISVSPEKVSTTTGRGKTIMYLGSILPLFDLLEVFGERAVENESDQLRIVIIEYKSKRVAYVVSDFLNPQKVVISEFDGGIHVPGLLGTAVLSGRQMAMVVDLPRFMELTLGADELEKKNAGAGFASIAELESQSQGNEQQQVPEMTAQDKKQQPDKERSYNSAVDVAGEDVEQPDSAFLQEVETMLAQLNKELLKLDEHRDKGTADSVFRLMHSIKGNLTMCGADTPSGVAHRTETILARARDGEIELSDEVFDVLFDCSSYLEEVVAAFLQGGKFPSVPDKLNAGLESFQKTHETPNDEDSKPIDLDGEQVVLDATGEFYLSSRRRDGASLYKCKIEFDPGDQPDYLVAYLILRKIQGVGDVLGTLPAMSEVESGRCGTKIVVLFAPREEKEGLLEDLGENLKQYYGVKTYEQSSFV